MKFKDSFHTYAVITILFWALAFVFTRLSLKYISTFSLGFLRYIAASFVLILFLYIFRIKPPEKKDLIWFVLSGISGFALYIILFNIGASYVTAATCSFVIATVPVFTALLAAVFYKEALKVHQWVAIIIEFTGIIILTLYNGALSVNKGIFWLLVAAVLLSFYNIIQRRLTRIYSALQATTYSILIGTLFLFIFAPRSVNEIKAAPFIVILYVVILGVFSSAIAYISWSKALAIAKKTSMVSNYMFFTPVITSILGYMIASEVPDASTIIGGIVILFGAVVFNANKRNKR